MGNTLENTLVAAVVVAIVLAAAFVGVAAIYGVGTWFGAF